MSNNPEFRFDLLDKKEIEAIAAEILKNMKTGMTLQDATGINDETLEEIYSLAYGYYDQGKYKESLSLFYLLTGISPKTYKYVFGLASSFHQMQAYEDAAFGFYLAFNLEPDNPLPAYYTTDCFLKLGLLEEATECAEVTILACDGRPEFQELKKRCELIRESIKIKK